MDDALRVVVEMHESLWGRLTHALEDFSAEEMHWRPLPHANTISVIIRHLRIEAQWHLDSLERGEPMPTIAVPAPQAAIDAVPADFEENFKRLEELLYAFCGEASHRALATLQQRTAAAYGYARRLTYALGYHQALHLAMHSGQIRQQDGLTPFGTTRTEARGTITADGAQFQATLVIEFLDSSGTVVLSAPGTATGTRIRVE